jgi:hypothetical protein
MERRLHNKTALVKAKMKKKLKVETEHGKPAAMKMAQ